MASGIIADSYITSSFVLNYTSHALFSGIGHLRIGHVIAQWVEHRAVMREVMSSTPAGPLFILIIYLKIIE